MEFLVSIFWNANEGRLRTGFRLVLHIVITFIVMMSAIIPISLVIGPGQPSTWLFMLLNLIQQTIVLGTVILACYVLDRRFFADLGMHINKRWWLDLLGGLALGGGMMAVIFLIEYSQGWIKLDEFNPNWSTLLPLQIGWLVTMITVGFSEEIFSRGYHMKNLMEGCKRIGAVPSFILATLISSSFFGVLHAMNPNATLIATIGVFMAGVMFCVGRVMTGSLAAPIGMHITWNYFQGAIFGFPVSGQSMDGSLIKIASTEDSIWTGGDFGPEAGLMGLFAILFLIAIFLMWPKRKVVSPQVVSASTLGSPSGETARSTEFETDPNPFQAPTNSEALEGSVASNEAVISEKRGGWNIGLAELATFRRRASQSA